MNSDLGEDDMTSEEVESGGYGNGGYGNADYSSGVVSRMEGAKKRLRRVANGMGRGALEAGARGVKSEIGEAFPGIAEFFARESRDSFDTTRNPYEADPYEADPYEADPYEADPEDPSESIQEGYEEKEPISFAFEYTSGENAREDNLLLAVAAWRAYAVKGIDFIAQHPATGITYFGGKEDFADFCANKDMDGTDWDIHSDPDVIMGMDHDPDTFEELVKNHDDEFLGQAKKQFEGFHWGDEAHTVGFLEIPGLSGEVPLTLLGVGREICYGAKKEGEWVEYYHIMGEESQTFPMVYALGNNTVLIHGGGMTIEDRGIVD